MPRINGNVKFFNGTRNFGMIEYGDNDREIFVHRSDIEDQPAYDLALAEPVSFQISEREGRSCAVDVHREHERHTGTVTQYSRRLGWGRIEPDDRPTELVFVHQSNIAMEGYRYLEEGTSVEFSLDAGRDGESQAILVLPDSRSALERFAYLASLDDHLQKLAGLAENEDWNYKKTQSQNPFPILRNYIKHTFRRVQEEGKISYAIDSKRNSSQLACFNTGLVTELLEPIYCAFFKNTDKTKDQPFVLHGFYKESVWPITEFSTRPDIADYIDDPAALVYDRHRELVKNVDHIIDERSDRFPEKYGKDPQTLLALLEAAVTRAENRARRNYKTAVPQYSNGKLQLLLPICLGKPNEAELALVVGRVEAVYKAFTVLDLDMAYNNARLLARPDPEWLRP